MDVDSRLRGNDKMGSGRQYNMMGGDCFATLTMAEWGKKDWILACARMTIIYGNDVLNVGGDCFASGLRSGRSRNDGESN